MRFALLALTGLLACSKGEPPPAARAKTPAAPTSAPASAPEASEISWRHDDLDGALGAARAAGVPVVIDLWAPWCHSCLAMQQTVFTDPGLKPLAGRFVWLALDTDKPENAAALERYPVDAWPTFFVISPIDGSIQARYVGSCSLAQFRELLRQGEEGHMDLMAAGGGLPPADPRRLVREGDRSAAAGNPAAAAAAYLAALTAAPSDWARRADVLVSYIGALEDCERWSDCVDLGLQGIAQTGASASVTDFIYHADVCASKLGDDPRVRDLRERASARLADLTIDAAAPLSIDDRGDALRQLRELRDNLADTIGAHRAAEAQRTLLDQAAASASSPLVAATYNWPRSEVYVYLERGADAIVFLAESERRLPTEYDPPYRLAWVYLQLGQHDQALAAAERALTKVYGPRKARTLSMIADIHKARGDRAGERAARQAAVDIYAGLSAGQKQPKAEQAARAALAALE